MVANRDSAALLTFALLVAITINSVVTDNQFQVITGAIFAISAAFIVFVVQPGEHQMVSRLVSSVRYAMATLVGLPILASLTITFLDRSTHWPLWIFSAASLPCMVVIVVAFSRARRRDRCPRISPWEQGIGIDAVGKSLDETTFADLEQAHRRFGFDKPAVMVQTAEAEHLEEPWTEEIDHDLKWRIERNVRVGA